MAHGVCDCSDITIESKCDAMRWWWWRLFTYAQQYRTPPYDTRITHTTPGQTKQKHTEMRNKTSSFNIAISETRHFKVTWCNSFCLLHQNSNKRWIELIIFERTLRTIDQPTDPPSYVFCLSPEIKYYCLAVNIQLNRIDRPKTHKIHKSSHRARENEWRLRQNLCTNW